eukprot:COSAG02_NODE_34_length_49821_cov_105.420438_19_plen_246_part_00
MYTVHVPRTVSHAQVPCSTLVPGSWGAPTLIFDGNSRQDTQPAYSNCAAVQASGRSETRVVYGARVKLRPSTGFRVGRTPRQSYPTWRHAVRQEEEQEGQEGWWCVQARSRVRPRDWPCVAPSGRGAGSWRRAMEVDRVRLVEKHWRPTAAVGNRSRTGRLVEACRSALHFHARSRVRPRDWPCVAPSGRGAGSWRRAMEVDRVRLVEKHWRPTAAVGNRSRTGRLVEACRSALHFHARSHVLSP